MNTATILAIVAIGISGITLLWTIGWSVYTHRSTTLARLTVRSSFSIPVYDNHLGPATIDITATNTGSVTVTVSGVQIKVKGRKGTLAPTEWVVQTPTSLPIVLEPGKHWTGLVSAQSIVDALARQYGQHKTWTIKGFVRDPASTAYEADKWTKLDVGAVGVFAEGAS